MTLGLRQRKLLAAVWGTNNDPAGTLFQMITIPAIDRFKLLDCPPAICGRIPPPFLDSPATNSGVFKRIFAHGNSAAFRAALSPDQINERFI